MSHNDRLRWLAQRGFIPETRTTTLPHLGTCLWIDGNKGMRPVSLWLSVRDGVAILHGVNDRDMTWEELQEWIEPAKVEEVRKPVATQKSLFEEA